MNKILIVEDTNIVRLKIIRTLEKYGFKNNVGINSAELIIDQPYLYLKDVDLIIMDIGLPGISGIEAAYWLKTNKTYSNTPIVFLSGASDSVTVKKALQAGGVDYIVKPFEETDLIKRIQKILGSPHYHTKEILPTFDVEEIKRIISIEYSRSIRGKQPVSFIVLTTSESDMTRQIDQVKDILRNIDQVYVLKPKELLLVLPLTDEKGLSVVVKKIEDWLCRDDILTTQISTYTNIGEDSQTLEELLNAILYNDESL